MTDQRLGVVGVAESESPVPQVFLSYQWEAQDQVRSLRDHLERLGYACWMDVGQMGGGDHLNARIEEGLRNCKVSPAPCLGSTRHVWGHGAMFGVMMPCLGSARIMFLVSPRHVFGQPSSCLGSACIMFLVSPRHVWGQPVSCLGSAHIMFGVSPHHV